MEIFIHRNGQDFGPYSPREIRDRIRSGQLLRTDMAWYEGATDWMPLSDVRLPPEEESALVRISRPSPTALQSHASTPITVLARVETKNCPFCAEPIKADAVKCRFCNETVDVRLRAIEEQKRAAEQQAAELRASEWRARENRRESVTVTQSVNITSPIYAPKADFPHGLHFVVTLLTAGIWLPIWILHYLCRDRRHYH